ncbi:hypothetical protein RB595_000524 [Gaeumannomyces hyphopodioides]
MQQRQRRYHQRSRNGCQQCKARHVRCDSGKPVCENCRRMGVGCVYTASPARVPRGSSLPRTPLREAEASAAVPRRGESAHMLHQPSPEPLRAFESSMTTPAPTLPRSQQEMEYPRIIRGSEVEATESTWVVDLPYVNEETRPDFFVDMTIWPQSGFIHGALPQASAASTASAALPQKRKGSDCQWEDPGARDSYQGQDGYQMHIHLCARPQEPGFGLGMRETAGGMEGTAVDTRINEMRSPLPMPDGELPMMLLQHPILTEVEPLPDAQK